ncbi:hypothetical protein [Actinophytocola sp.]|uniref:hypothetical protein n=1 Tax=Actinophytocola sp. TaxID=1872138 RepID=UPI00389AC4E2
MRNLLLRAVLTVAAVAGLVLGSTTVAGAVPAATCAQLSAQLTRLYNLLDHVSDPDAQSDLLIKIEVLEARMEAQGCFASTVRTFTATVSVWTTTSLAPGPYVKDISFQVRFINTGTATWTLPTTVFPGGVTISQRSGLSASGSWAGTGYLALTAPIDVATSLGSATGTLNITTGSTITINDGTTRTGSPISSPGDQKGNVTLVGTTPLTIGVVQLNAMLQMTGTLS